MNLLTEWHIPYQNLFPGYSSAYSELDAKQNSQSNRITSELDARQHSQSNRITSELDARQHSQSNNKHLEIETLEKDAHAKNFIGATIINTFRRGCITRVNI